MLNYCSIDKVLDSTKYQFSLSACDCNPFGSLSERCDELTGQCPCKEKYIGRTCSRCKVGFLSFHVSCEICDWFNRNV